MIRKRHSRAFEGSGIALIAVCLTAWSSFTTLRALLLDRPQHGSVWLAPFWVVLLPRVGIWLNLFLEIALIWIVIALWRELRGTLERLMVMCYVSLIFLGQFQHILPSMLIPIQCLEAIAACVAFGAALVLFVRSRRIAKNSSKRDIA